MIASTERWTHEIKGGTCFRGVIDVNVQGVQTPTEGLWLQVWGLPAMTYEEQLRTVRLSPTREDAQGNHTLVQGSRLVRHYQEVNVAFMEVTVHP